MVFLASFYLCTIENARHARRPENQMNPRRGARFEATRVYVYGYRYSHGWPFSHDQAAAPSAVSNGTETVNHPLQEVPA